MNELMSHPCGLVLTRIHLRAAERTIKPAVHAGNNAPRWCVWT